MILLVPMALGAGAALLALKAWALGEAERRKVFGISQGEAAAKAVEDAILKGAYDEAQAAIDAGSAAIAAGFDAGQAATTIGGALAGSGHLASFAATQARDVLEAAFAGITPEQAAAQADARAQLQKAHDAKKSTVTSWGRPPWATDRAAWLSAWSKLVAGYAHPEEYSRFLQFTQAYDSRDFEGARWQLFRHASDLFAPGGYYATSKLVDNALAQAVDAGDWHKVGVLLGFHVPAANWTHPAFVNDPVELSLVFFADGCWEIYLAKNGSGARELLRAGPTEVARDDARTLEPAAHWPFYAKPGDCMRSA